MRYLVAIALLVLAVAEAHHIPEHTLRGARFSTGKLHLYDVEFNVTSGVRGLSTQVSKLGFRAELQIYAKTEKEHILQIKNVYSSGSLKAVESKDEDILLEKSNLEDTLSIPIKFTLENGEVTSYTLSPRETLESKKIKKSILRSLDMRVTEETLQQMESNSGLNIPVRYNISENFGSGIHTSYYLITVSPNVEYPYDSSVYNISRSEDFEGERYHSYKFHHNFFKQGCSEVCRDDWKTNMYGAGCPVGYEPHQSPIKTYVLHQHHLVLENGVMTPEIIMSTEVHTAKMYDQDMEVEIRYYIRKTGYNKKTIEEPSRQKSFTDLNDQDIEINEKEINEQCYFKSSTKPTEVAKKLLREIAQIIVRADLDRRESTIIGEKIILLKNALAQLEVSDLKTVAADIKRKGSLKSASEEEKVKRQIWLEILPVIGTENAVTFIVHYIQENIERELLVWEAKEILEALPQNIHRPTERSIKELRTLLTLSKVKTHHLLHSAVHTCLGRVLGSICNGTDTERSYSVDKAPWFSRSQEQPMSSSLFNSVECPEDLLTEIVKEISDKLRSTKKQDEIIIYIETLTEIGVPEVLPIITEYAYGNAENIQDFSPSYYEFVRTASVYSLHKVAEKLPEEVLEIVVPLFFNESEYANLRTAAFGVLIRSQPSLEILQHIAVLSWTEKSNEVGSCVTSAFDTFGNSTLPCMFLTSRRIKQVMPMLKRFDIGIQHTKNLLWSYFDDIRAFGLRAHLAHVPSNESIIPSALYEDLSYSSDSLTDAIVQSALHIQGLTERKVIQYIDQQILGISPPETISSSKEREIFEEAKVVERIPETLRLTIYKRMFYRSAFYYLDLQNIKIQVDSLREYLRTYLTKTSFDYSGHLVKVFLPSTFHTATVAKTLPYPVEFQMLQPTVFALKIESKERNPTLPNFHFLIRPSLYVSRLFTNQLKNIGDCKEIGVYHENKIAVSYPFEVKFQLQGLMNVTVSYKVPELPKKVLYYFTEAGTYAGKKSLEMLPSSEDREPIRTLPSSFKYSPKVNIVGVPPIEIDLHTEDIDLITEIKPTTPLEAIDIAVRKILNAGWRYRAINITIEDDSRVWPKDTEVTFNFQYNSSHVTKEKLRMNKQQPSPWSMSETEDYRSSSMYVTEQPEPDDDDDDNEWRTEDSPKKWFWDDNHKDDDTDEDWSKDLNPNDIYDNKKLSLFVDQARRISTKLSSLIPHITHVLNIEVETKPVYNTAYIRVEYNHTHTKSLHAVHVDAAIKTQKESESQKISIDHLMGFLGKIDEFEYNSHDDNHKALFITALRSHPMECDCPWKDVEVVSKGEFYYDPLDNLLNKELENKVERAFFLSEKHEECMEDVKDGHSMSMSCMKAVWDRSIYNKLKMSILWNRNLPLPVRYMARRLDTYIKHVYYNYMSIKDEQNDENRIRINLEHIDKLTDEPVFDVTIRKPQETIEFSRVRAIGDPLSSVHDVLGVDLMLLTNNTYPPTCVMMEKYVRTYDLVSYPISLDRCSYVLSAHCTDYKNFAIISKILSTDGTKEIRIYVGPHTVILTPRSGSHYTIKYDDKDYPVSQPVVFDEDSAEIYVFAERYSSTHEHLEVVASKAGIRVTYDGKNVKVQIDPRYKGETCGLCSEFDGETLREFRGVDRCLYSHYDDFVNSAITNRQTCRKQPLYPHICEDDDSSKKAWGRDKDSDEYEPSTKRNVIIVKGNEICFSILPVPVCENDAKPSETESESVGFHCLPKKDITAKRMVSEAKRRSLGELENKTVDFEEDVEVAKMC